MSLLLFKQTFLDLLTAQPDWNLSISGCAKITELDLSVYYSVSLIPSTNDLKPPSAFLQFETVPLPGFTYFKVQTLEFDSDILIPQPKWRIQVLYKL